jgi:hypothetical protein
MHKNEPKKESNQATLARVKKEMDQPRKAKSTREEDVNQTTRQELGKAAIILRGQESRAVRAQGFPREKNNGKANQASS